MEKNLVRFNKILNVKHTNTPKDINCNNLKNKKKLGIIFQCILIHKNFQVYIFFSHLNNYIC